MATKIDGQKQTGKFHLISPLTSAEKRFLLLSRDLCVWFVIFGAILFLGRARPSFELSKEGSLRENALFKHLSFWVLETGSKMSLWCVDSLLSLKDHKFSELKRTTQKFLLQITIKCSLAPKCILLPFLSPVQASPKNAEQYIHKDNNNNTYYLFFEAFILQKLKSLPKRASERVQFNYNRYYF